MSSSASDRTERASAVVEIDVAILELPLGSSQFRIEGNECLIVLFALGVIKAL